MERDHDHAGEDGAASGSGAAEAHGAAEGGVTRRVFLHATAVGAAAAWVGCGEGESPADPGGGGPGGPGGGGPGTGGAGPGGGGPGTGGGGGMTPTPQCEESAENIEGPYYTPGAPTTNVLVTDGMPGVRLRLSGRVHGAEDCAALSDAHLDFWQADADGAYDSVGFTLRGQFDAEPDGSYTLDTLIPGHYLNGTQYRPAHIHVKVSAPGHVLLTTQLYFEGDPYNDIDPFIDASLIMQLDEAPDGGKSAVFDFVLAKA